MSITDKIKAIRDELRLSQAEIARRLEIEPPSYHRLENRGDKLSIEQLDSIAKALGVSRMHILNWGEPTVDDHAQADKAGLLKQVSELEDRLKDKQFIIDKQNEDIEDTARLINMYMEHLVGEVSNQLRVGTIHYTDETGSSVMGLLRNISKDEYDTSWWSYKDLRKEVSQDEKELVIKTLFTDERYARAAVYLMNTGLIKDEALTEAYIKYDSDISIYFPGFHFYKLMKAKNQVLKVFDRLNIKFE
jgi:transcriptional regulator with XRE-family HTH domain